LNANDISADILDASAIVTKDLQSTTASIDFLTVNKGLILADLLGGNGTANVVGPVVQGYIDYSYVIINKQVILNVGSFLGNGNGTTAIFELTLPNVIAPKNLQQNLIQIFNNGVFVLGLVKLFKEEVGSSWILYIKIYSSLKLGSFESTGIMGWQAFTMSYTLPDN
jgi:hypothetical protein